MFIVENDCGKGKCWCVSNGHKACLIHKRDFGDCIPDHCSDVEHCHDSGYWCDDTQLVDNKGKNEFSILQLASLNEPGAQPFLSLILLFIENYVLKHQGHCAEGWAGSNKHQNNVDGCFKECSSRRNVGYFSFNPKNGDCACYLRNAGCPDDDLYNDYNSYNIIRSNCSIILDFLFRLKIYFVKSNLFSCILLY